MAIGTPTLNGSGTSTTNNTTVTANTTNAGTAGSLIVVFTWARVATQLTGVVSGGGLTWTNLDFATTAQGGCTLAYAQDPSGIASATTLTTTWSATATRKGMTIYVCTGLDTSASVEDTAFRPTGASGTTGNASVTAAATSAQNDELFLFLTRHNAATGSVTGTASGTGFVELDDFIVGSSTFVQCYSSYKIASATEQPTPGSTFTDTTTNWHAGTAAFKAAAADAVLPTQSTIRLQAVNRSYTY